jgi:4-hydroxyacetophenone monooxygenase
VSPPGNPHAGSAFTDDAATIRAHLEDVSVPALLCSLVHMTGDPSWIRGNERPRMLTTMEFQSGMREAEQAAVRDRAVEAIVDYREGGCAPHSLPAGLVCEMMEFLAARPMIDAAVPLMMEELQLDGADSRSVTWRDTVSEEQRAESPVVVIGCGESGIVAGIRLKEAGLPFTIVERAPAPGGTWQANRYPGARVDVGSHHYSYSFEPSETWTEYFCRQPELQRYFEHVVDKHGLRQHCRFDTEVVRASWDDDAQRWRVVVRDAGGQEDAIEARFVISAVGALSLPRTPRFDGMESFKGPSFHSARWPADLDLKGKKFALIGAGATGFQIAPTIVDDVDRLAIFQRTPQWILPNPSYHLAVPPGDKWAMRHLPFYGRWLRFLMMYPGISISTDPFKCDPEFDDLTGRGVNPSNAKRREQLSAWMASILDDRTDLLQKSVPAYPPAGKRILQDNGSWLRCLMKPNVDFVNTPIARIEPDAVVTTDGERYEADIICYATGFQANDYLAPMEFTGRGGASLSAQWGDEPRGYLGITVPNFPNLFLLYGPGTNLAHGASIILHSECQVQYTMEAIRTALQDGARTIEVRQDVLDAYMTRYRAEIDQLIWSHPTIEHTHYKNPNGKIFTLSPWPIEVYWEWTQTVDAADYVLR